MGKKQGEDTAATAEPSSPKGYSTPRDVVLSNESWGKEEEEGGCSARWRLSSQATATCDGALVYWRWRHTRLPMARGEGIPCCAFLTMWLLLYLLNQFYLNPRVLSRFRFSPILPQRRQRAAGWGSVAGWA